jgi:hypothetical protein
LAKIREAREALEAEAAAAAAKAAAERAAENVRSYPASLRGLIDHRREPRWIFARFHLNGAKAMPVQTSSMSARFSTCPYNDDATMLAVVKLTPKAPRPGRSLWTN